VIERTVVLKPPEAWYNLWRIIIFVSFKDRIIFHRL